MARRSRYEWTQVMRRLETEVRYARELETIAEAAGDEELRIVRPFYPGGDYENFEYSDNCVVIDNPPFSILAQIPRFYAQRGIDYFLFANHKTILGVRAARSHIVCGAIITYENGAKVNTSFIASKGALIRSAPTLYQAIKKAQNNEASRLPKYAYPDSVVTFSVIANLTLNGIEYEEDDAVFIRALDAQRQNKKSIYGDGFFVPEAKIKAAREAAAIKFALSEREQRIVDELNARAAQ